MLMNYHSLYVCEWDSSLLIKSLYNFNELFTPVVLYLIRIHGEAYFKTFTSLLDLSKK